MLSTQNLFSFRADAQQMARADAKTAEAPGFHFVPVYSESINAHGFRNHILQPARSYFWSDADKMYLYQLLSTLTCVIFAEIIMHQAQNETRNFPFYALTHALTDILFPFLCCTLFCPAFPAISCCLEIYFQGTSSFIPRSVFPPPRAESMSPWLATHAIWKHFSALISHEVFSRDQSESNSWL